MMASWWRCSTGANGGAMVAALWRYSGVLVVSWWRCSGVMVAALWRHGGVGIYT